MFYIYTYVWYVRIPYMHSAMMQYFHSHVRKKLYVQLTYGIQRKEIKVKA